MLGRFAKRNIENTSITNREIRMGAAIRYVSCVTYGEELFFLELRCLCSEEIQDDFDIVVKGEHGKRPDLIRRSCVEIEPPKGDDQNKSWFETQFVVALPSGFGTLYVDCRQVSTGHVLVHSRADKSLWSNRLIADYYARIRNPLVDDRYESWLERQRPNAEQIAKQAGVHFDYMPLVSLVSPVYCTDPEHLKTMIDSVLAQSYGNWELVIVNASPDDEGVCKTLALFDDKRIKVVEHAENDGINGNTNCGIAASAGDYIGFIDHDDFIEPNLLYEYVKAINEQGKPGLLYCDEDSYGKNRGYMLALFKPDANIDLLYSNNYVVHLLMVSRQVIEKTERSGSQFNGAQDYDLTLQAFHMGEKIVHIPKPLYHWRVHELSTNDGNTDAKPYTNTTGANALAENICRRKLDAEVQKTDVPFAYRCTFRSKYSKKDVSVIVDAGSMPAITERNRRAREAQGRLILFASPSTKIIGGEAIDVLTGYFARAEVGVLAPRLVNPDGLVAQTGLVLRKAAGATCMGQGMPADDGGYLGRFHRPCNFTAVSGDCCMLRRDEFLELGGYCEEFKTLLYANVDLCMRLNAGGKHTVYTPFATFEHVQQLFEPVGERIAWHKQALEHDKALLRERHPDAVGKPDPLFNQNLDEVNPYFVLAH